MRKRGRSCGALPWTTTVSLRLRRRRYAMSSFVTCRLCRCEYAFRSTPTSGSPARCAPLSKPRISACSTFNSPTPTVTISAMSAADKPPEQTMDHGYAFKKSVSHADECVRLAGLTDDLIVRDQLLDLAQEWMLAARRAHRPSDDTRVVSLHTNQDNDDGSPGLG